MKTSKRHVVLLTMVILSLPACTVGPLAPNAAPVDAVGTIVAMTMQAHGSATAPAFTATTQASPAPVTATTKPTVAIKTNNAQCRAGPAPKFDVIATYSAGTTVDMVAKDTADGYWLVKDPSSGTSCWVQTQDATAAGSFDLLPEVTPQAGTQGAPAQPTVFYPNYSCDPTGLTTTLTWNDAADNEKGYRVYRDGVQIADLPANSTKYSETIAFTLGSQVTYAVEAYNDAGASPQRTLSFHCP
jgi:hypothetical protein